MKKTKHQSLFDLCIGSQSDSEFVVSLYNYIDNIDKTPELTEQVQKQVAKLKETQSKKLTVLRRQVKDDAVSVVKKIEAKLAAANIDDQGILKAVASFNGYIRGQHWISGENY